MRDTNGVNLMKKRKVKLMLEHVNFKFNLAHFYNKNGLTK